MKRYNHLRRLAPASRVAAVRTRLQTCVRASDRVARLGGDEFGLVLPHQADAAELERVLDKLSVAVEEPIDLDGLALASVESSIGVAVFPDDGDSAEELMKRADMAMYQAKQERQRYLLYERLSHHDEPIRLKPISRLRRTLVSIRERRGTDGQRRSAPS